MGQLGGLSQGEVGFQQGDPDRTIENTHTFLNKQTDTVKEVTPAEAKADWTVANQTSAAHSVSTAINKSSMWSGNN